MRHLALASLVVLPLCAQEAPKAKPVEFTLPAFVNGDGRQKLSEFFGQPVVITTFYSGWGGTTASDAALKLHDAHAADGLVVVLSHNAPLVTTKDGTEIEPAAWAMRMHSKARVRVCGAIQGAPWKWSGLPPYYAVLGPDGVVVSAGNVQKNTKEMEEAVATAVKQAAKGWGTSEQSAVRAHYARGEFAKARSKTQGDLAAEVDALFERRCRAVEWLTTDGQWLRAKKEAEQLAAAAKGIATWDPAIADLLGKFADDKAKRELELDNKLERALAAMAKNGPDKDAPRRIRAVAQKEEGSTVAARANRLATFAAQALEIR